MPFINPSTSFQKTSEITRALRLRDSKLLSVLPSADGLYYSPSEHNANINFPRRRQWMLEWIAQRLQEDEGDGGREGRTSPKTWKFLKQLLENVRLEEAGSALEKRGLIDTIAVTMRELREIHCQENLLVSNIVPKRPDDAFGAQYVEDQGIQVLEAISGVILIWMDSVKPSETLRMTMKINIEKSAVILGDYFILCNEFLRQGKQIQQNWVDAIVWIWKGSIRGISDAGRVSRAWAKACLLPGINLYLTSYIPKFLKDIIRGMIEEFLFSPNASPGQNIAQKPLSLEAADIRHLLTPLRSSLTRLNIHLASELFQIAVDSVSKWKKIKPEDSLIGMIFLEVLGAVHREDFVAPWPENVSQVILDDVYSMLAVIGRTELLLPLDTLVELVRNTSNICCLDIQRVKWNIILEALNIDSDIFIHESNESLLAELCKAISRQSTSNFEIDSILHLLVVGFCKARDLTRMLIYWKQGLKDNPSGIWQQNQALKFCFADKIECSFTPAQIENLVEELSVQREWTILEGVLVGIHKETTVDHIITCDVLRRTSSRLLNITKQMLPGAWRILVRISEVQPELSNLMTESAHWVLHNSEPCPVAESAVQILLRAGHTQAIPEGVESVLRYVLKVWKTHIDDNSNRGNNILGFASTTVAIIVARYLKPLDMVEIELKNAFIYAFLTAAFKSNSAENVWYGMIKQADFFESTTLKNSVLSALIQCLNTCADAATNVTSESQRLGTCPNSQNQIEILISSILEYPPNAINRRARESILQVCFIIDSSGLSIAEPVINKLLKQCNARFLMATEAQTFATYFQKPRAENIARRIIKHALMNKDQSKFREFLSRNIKTVSCFLKLSELKEWQMKMTITVVTQLWDVRDNLEVDPDGLIRETRRKILSYLGEVVTSRQTCKNADLIAWCQIWMLQRDNHPEAARIACHMAGYITRCTAEEWDTAVEALILIYIVAEEIEDFIRATALTIFLHEKLRKKIDPTIFESYRSMYMRANSQMQVHLLGKVFEGCHSSEMGGLSWELLLVLVQNLKRPEDISIIPAISRLHQKIVLVLPSCSSSAALFSISSSVDIFLADKSWAVSQFTIDTVLAAVKIAVSPGGPVIESIDPNEFYALLTRILSSILTHHRHRTRGRHSLIIGLLQQLMTVLFSPRLSRRKHDVVTHPPWIQSAHTNPINLKSARAFSRLLYTFCDPPISTVRNQKSNLADSDRSKERKLVSTTILPVLELYFQQILLENINIEVRKELGLGIDKVLDLLGREGLAKLSERMTTESRAIMKGLWFGHVKNSKERV